MNPYIPSADTIPVAWGWFQFLLLLTFPLHLLAMNSMLGGLGIAVYQQFRGGAQGQRVAYRYALALPLIIAFVVNLGVAPLLFLQVLYGQFIYTSSVLMGVFWILIVPVLIIAYYGAYIYDFQFTRLGAAGPWLGTLLFVLLLVIGYFFSNNMLLMTLPQQFGDYFQNRGGTILASDHSLFMPRYLHMMFGALAVGGLAIGLLGRIKGASDPELAHYAGSVGLKAFRWFTLANLAIGTWYLLSLERDTMLIFMGGNMMATLCFTIALLLVLFVLHTSFRDRLWPTVIGLVPLVYLMTFMRAWLRTDFLADYFNLGQLQVVPEYSPMIFFFLTLVGGVFCVGWMLKKTAEALS
jgi:hypothetical protein